MFFHISTPGLFMRPVSLSVYRTNEIGPKTEPRGNRRRGSNISSKKEKTAVNEKRTTPEMIQRGQRDFSVRILSSTVSKAARHGSSEYSPGSASRFLQVLKNITYNHHFTKLILLRCSIIV